MGNGKNSSKDHAQKTAKCALAGDGEKAIIHDRKAVESDDEPPFRVYAELGNRLLHGDRLDEAEEVYRHLAERYPDRPRGIAGLAQLAYRKQDWETALTRWNDCFSKFGRQAQSWWYSSKGNALLQLNRLDEAEEIFHELIRIHPDRPQGFVGLAQSAQRRRDWETALSRWSLVIDKFPKDLNARIRKGYMLINMERFAEAESVFEETTAGRPDDSAPLMGLVHVARAKMDSESVITRYDSLLAKYPDDVAARFHRAKALAQYGNHEGFRDFVKRYLTEPESGSNSVGVDRMLLIALQFTYTGYRRIKLLEKLSAMVHRSAPFDTDIEAGLLAADIRFALGDFEGMARIVEKLQNGSVRPPHLQSLCSVSEKYRSESYPDFHRFKIFGVGLSRTATTSLNAALNLLGFHSIHWLNPHTQSLISDRDFFLFDGFTDIVISCRFESLYYTFPNSVFIYTNRSLESWLRSVAAHYKTVHDIEHPAELNAQAFKQRYNLSCGPVEANLFSRRDSWEDAYLDFDDRIRSFFKDKPKERFLELRICEGEGWEKLCPFLGMEIPDRPFPKENQTAGSAYRPTASNG